VTAREIHQHREREREGPDGEGTPHDPQHQHRAEPQPDSRCRRDREVASGPSCRTEDDQRRPRPERITHTAPQDREGDERPEFGDKKPRPREDAVTAPEGGDRLVQSRIQEHL
jgi:hypothetical protein